MFTTALISVSMVIFSRMYIDHERYEDKITLDADQRAERISTAILPSIWEVYKKSVERKFSQEYSSSILDSELASSNIDAIVVLGRFGHFYLGKYKDVNNKIKSYKSLDEFEALRTQIPISYPIKNKGMTIGSIELILNPKPFKEELIDLAGINLIQIFVLITIFFSLTYFGIRISLLRPMQRIALTSKTIDILNEGIIYMDENFKTTELNNTAKKILQTGNDNLIGENGLDFFQIGSKENEDYIKEHKALKLDTHLRKPNMAGQTFLTNVLELKNNNNEFLNYVLKFEDVTERMNLVSETIKAKENAEIANKRKSTFLANMSHEIRSPLNSIIGFSKILHEKDESSSEDTSYAKTAINIASSNLMNVVNSIIDFSKIEAGEVVLEKEYFNLNKILDDLFLLFSNQSKENGVRLSIDNKASEFIYLSDKVKISQIVTNLLSNAIKFSAGGKVHIELIVTDVKSKYSTIQIRVIDNGLGISKEQLNHVFEPFKQADESTTRKFGGTGLGLSISKHFASLLGGSLRHSENPTGGSIFTLELKVECRVKPAFDVSGGIERNIELSKKDLTEEPIEPGGVLEILAVDDQEMNLKLIEIYFRKYNFIKVDKAINGKIAFELFQKKKYDLVLLDMHMPVLDGQKALKLIRGYESDNNLKETIIFIVSANTIKENIDEFMELGANKYILKPINFSLLKSEINSYKIKQFKL